MRFDDVELGIPGRRMRFAFPSPVWVWQGCSVEADALGCLGPKKRSLLQTLLHQGCLQAAASDIFAATLLGLLVCYRMLASKSALRCITGYIRVLRIVNVRANK